MHVLVWDVGKWHFIRNTVLAKVGHIEQLDHTSLIYDRINPTLKNDNWSKGAPKYFMLLTTPWTGLWLHTSCRSSLSKGSLGSYLLPTLARKITCRCSTECSSCYQCLHIWAQVGNFSSFMQQPIETSHAVRYWEVTESSLVSQILQY